MNLHLATAPAETSPPCQGQSSHVAGRRTSSESCQTLHSGDTPISWMVFVM